MLLICRRGFKSHHFWTQYDRGSVNRLVAQMVEARKRHCWECLRRRLVCDFQVPCCKRCVGSGVNCPGYAEIPPIRLKWLAPGKVKSRQRTGSSNCQKNNRAQSDSVSSDISRGGFVSAEADTGSSDESPKSTVPRFHLKTDHHALLDFVQYCMSITLECAAIQPVKCSTPEQLIHACTRNYPRLCD